MAKKLFTVHRNCYATIDVSVTAETEEEAIRIASKKFDRINPSEYRFDENLVEVIDTQDYDDPTPLITEAINAIRECTDNIGDEICIKSVEVEATVYVWDDVLNVGDYENRTVWVDTVYLCQDNDGDIEIIVRYDEDYQRAYDLEDRALSEFSEIEQLRILQAILA